MSRAYEKIIDKQIYNISKQIDGITVEGKLMFIAVKLLIFSLYIFKGRRERQTITYVPTIEKPRHSTLYRQALEMQDNAPYSSSNTTNGKNVQFKKCNCSAFELFNADIGDHFQVFHGQFHLCHYC